jgi:hypothetical protein
MSTLREGPAGGPTSEARTAALLYLGAAAALLLTTSARVGTYDEGLVLTGALRVLHGEWPSRDFYANYGPAQFACVAGAFQLLGTSVLSARVWDALSQALLVPMVWLALRPLGSQALRAAALALASALLIDRAQHLYPVAVCAALSFAAGVVAARALARRAPWQAFWPVTPLLVALFCFRYDLALGVGAALALAVGAVLVLQRRSGSVARAQALRIVAFNGLLLAAGCAAALALLAWAGALAPALSDLWTYNGANYVQMRSLPFPGPRELLRSPLAGLCVYFAPPAVALALATLVRRSRRAAPGAGGAGPDERAITALVFACLALPFFAKGSVRVSAQAMVPADLAAIVALAACADSWRTTARARRWTLAIAGVALALALGGRVRKSVWLAQRPEAAERFPWFAPFSVEPERFAAASYVRDHSAPEERVLSATGRHDRVVLDDNAFYFLAQRLPGTRWHHYDPGVQTSAAVQIEMIAELERHGVRWIVRDTSADERVEPNRSAQSSGVHLLDDHIATRFREVARYGPITVLEREAPAGSPPRSER